ncbi:MAG TPA: inorganic phosphate transporter [Candidatus Baltobacteraceae bacterium]|jgi:PiT family inorganic phosphate transporter|nr:inorganic phosphate transporter [Candidatus Baltobacteraceae bacterium]
MARMEHVFGALGTTQLVCLVSALALALGFEFVNGFHDTANAVATVIYTHSLPPWLAVVWSGIWNLLGVLRSTGGVAFAIVSLLPVELVMNVGSAAGFAMVFSLLTSAILWNLGTWYLGLPASSSHTLIGSIMGVGLMNSLITTGSVRGGINWSKAEEVGLSLLVSPVVGFVGTAILFLLIKALIHKPELYSEPDPKKAPPLWIRGTLCLTCTGVSYMHGSNDGQKGIGLLMLILVGIVPGIYALDLSTTGDSIHQLTVMSQGATAILQKHAGGQPLDMNTANTTLAAYIKSDGTFSENVYPALAEKSDEIASTLADKKSVAVLSEDQRKALRNAIYFTSETIGKLSKSHTLSNDEDAILTKFKDALDKTIKFIPVWVKFAVAIALGFGTMIGWKRIVVTVGEKIGKSHLTYAQGASAEAIAMITIGLADTYGMPVSTTHVLSSGVAGAMAANKSGLQTATLRNLLLAWVLTLPVCVFLGAGFFAGGLRLMARVFGLH